MDNFLPIFYDGFWDVPSAFLTVYKDKLFLFWRGYFDEKLDDYPTHYKVYLVKNISLENVLEVRNPSHEAVRMKNVPLLLENEIAGEIPTKEVIFDKTKRKFINSKVFYKLLAN